MQTAIPQIAFELHLARGDGHLGDSSCIRAHSGHEPISASAEARNERSLAREGSV
jgi:hypothetical protein